MSEPRVVRRLHQRHTQAHERRLEMRRKLHSQAAEAQARIESLRGQSDVSQALAGAQPAAGPGDVSPGGGTAPAA